MQQYVDMKSENPDALLMFRLGDFYESFFEDARTISATLGLVLTARGTDGNGNDIPMCGIPWHAADNYFGRLVRAGYKVALVEQMETPAQAKARGHKFIERRVVRVLTPGTLTDENLLTPKNSNFLVAISPIGGGAYDIAGCDISTGEFFVGQTSDAIDDLVRINPAEVIFPFHTAEEKTISKLRELFKAAPVYEKLYHRADIDMVVSRVFGGAVDAVPYTLTGAVAVVKEMLAVGIVDEHHREEELLLGVEGDEAVYACGGLLAAAYDVRNELGELAVDAGNQVASIVDDDVRADFKHAADVGLILLGSGSVPGEDIQTRVVEGCRNVVLGGEGIAAGDVHLRTAGGEHLAKVGRLGLKVYGQGYFQALERQGA